VPKRWKVASPTRDYSTVVHESAEAAIVYIIQKEVAKGADAAKLKAELTAVEVDWAGEPVGHEGEPQR